MARIVGLQQDHLLIQTDRSVTGIYFLKHSQFLVGRLLLDGIFTATCVQDDIPFEPATRILDEQVNHQPDSLNIRECPIL